MALPLRYEVGLVHFHVTAIGIGDGCTVTHTTKAVAGRQAKTSLTDFKSTAVGATGHVITSVTQYVEERSYAEVRNGARVQGEGEKPERSTRTRGSHKAVYRVGAWGVV